MSMTTEQRLEWAHQNLDRYLRECEVSEFLAELADVSHLADRVCDLENTLEDVDRSLNHLNRSTEELADRIDVLEEAS